MDTGPFGWTGVPTLTGLTGLAAQVMFSGFVMLEVIHWRLV